MNQEQIIETLINHWKEQYTRLGQVLSDERLALQKRDFNEMELAIQRKNAMILEINEQSIPANLAQHLNQPIELNQIKQISNSSTRLSPLWENLKTLVENCRYENEVNGNMVELVATSTKRTFNLIRGINPDNRLYNSEGDNTNVSYRGQALTA